MIENLEYRGGVQDLRGPEMKRRGARVLELTGLQDRAKETVKRYSWGMKRRLHHFQIFPIRVKSALIEERHPGGIRDPAVNLTETQSPEIPPRGATLIV